LHPNKLSRLAKEHKQKQQQLPVPDCIGSNKKGLRAKHNAHGYQEGDNEREIDAN